MNRYYQQGGEMEQLMQLFQVFADAVQDDEFSTAEEVMQMFQQLSPEEQQAFVQQAMQMVQAPQQEQMELEEEPTMQRGGYVNNTGYLEGYKTSKNPYNVIPSSKISMIGVDPKIKYIKGTDNLGNTQYMEHGGEYEFDGDFVIEEPVYAQTGEKIYRFNPEKNKFTQRKTSIQSLEKTKPQLTFTKEELKPLSSSAKVTADLMNKEEQLKRAFRFKELTDKVKTNQFLTPKEQSELRLVTSELGEILPKSTFLKSKFPNILETVQEVSKGISNSKFGQVTSKVLKSPITKGVLNATELAGMVQGAVQGLSYDDKLLQLSNDSKSNPIAKSYLEKWNKAQGNEDVLNEYVALKKNQFKGVVLPEDKPLPKISKGVDYQRIFGGKQNENFSFVPQQSTSLKQDKPKVTLPPKKVNKEIAKQVATPEVLPPPVPTEIPEMVDNNYQFEIPVMDVGNYYVPQEDRTVELNPNAFNRTNIGVGKRFFKQAGGYVAPEFEDIDLGLSPRLQGNDAYVGARSNQQRYDNFNTRTKLFPKLSSLEPINQYDTIPMGAVSANYQAPNEQSRKMFEGKGSNQLLDLGNYASRFGEKNLGLGTQPVQNIERKSKFQEFMDKYGKKSDLSFDSNQNNLASAYNLMKASEPLANQYRANVDLKYAETPMLDPLPIVQELYNQQRLATQNVNTNSATGQVYLSNINAQTQQKTVELLNDVQQKNAQIAAQNEQARIAAYNQEQQLNIAANQQYLQNQMLAQAQKDEMMGSALNDIDKIRNERIKNKNNFNSLAAITPGLKKSTNLRNLVTGNQGFEIDPEYQKLQYYTAQYKTPQQLEAEKAKKQIGGSINQFLKRK